MPFLFSYGTLQKEEVQTELFGRILHSTGDRLSGYKIVTIEITDKAFLAKGENKLQQTLVASGNDGDFVEGSVLEVTDDELIMADKYEPQNYKRITVILESGKSAYLYRRMD